MSLTRDDLSGHGGGAGAGKIAILEEIYDASWLEEEMVVMAYQTHDRIVDYGFSIEFLPDAGWRIYIVFLPCLRGDYYRCSHLPYQSIDRNGRRYVDWSAKIETLGEARVVAELWAELTRDCQHIEAHTPNSDAAAEEPGTVQQPRTDAA